MKKRKFSFEKYLILSLNFMYKYLKKSNSSKIFDKLNQDKPN